MVSFPVSPEAVGGGNPAGVVLDPAVPDPAPEEMTETAVRLNPLSETAFVWAGDDTSSFRFRYFAPGGEVALCGHATAAAYGALALDGRLGNLPARVRSAAPGGRVSGRVERERDGVVVWMDMPVAERVGAELDLGAVAEAVGLPVEVLTSRPRAAVEDVGIRVALLPVADLAALDAMRPDFDRLRELGRDDRVVVWYPFVFDHEAGRIRARSFAPAVDIDEDPATGTAVASLAAYLAREGLVAEHSELRIRQGEAMGRPSEIRLELRSEGRRPTSVRIGGWVIGTLAGND